MMILRRWSVAVLLAATCSCHTETKAREAAEAEVRHVLTTELYLLQELYHARHTTYATSWATLTGDLPSQHPALSGPTARVQIIIHAADSAGWSASASVPEDGRFVCVAYHGNPPALASAGLLHLRPQASDLAVCSQLGTRER